MENIEIEGYDINNTFVIYVNSPIVENGKIVYAGEYKTINGIQLLQIIEDRLHCIAFCSAIDYHINRSINDNEYSKQSNGFYKDFEEGKLDENKDIRIQKSLDCINNDYYICYIIENGIVKNIEQSNTVNKIKTIYMNSLDLIDRKDFKYLDDFVQYLNNKKRILKEGE